MVCASHTFDILCDLMNYGKECISISTNYINKYVRKISIINLIIPTVLSVFLIGLNHIISFSDIMSPVYITSASKAVRYYSKDKRIADVYLKNLYYTGYNSIVNNKIDGYYYYTIENGTCTFVLVDAKSIDTPVNTLTSYSAKAIIKKNNKQITNMISKFSNDLSWTMDGMLNVSSACYIDETAYNTNLYLYLMIFAFILTVLIMSYLIINTIYIIFPAFCPACICFKKISNPSDTLTNVNYEIDHSVINTKKIIITENYFIYHSCFNIVILPVNKITKIYKNISVHRLYTKLYKKKIYKKYNLYVTCKNNHTYHMHDISSDTITSVCDYIELTYPEITLLKMHNRM